jgi:hypothetical protein
MDLIDETGAKAGTYNVTITNAQGVQIGDNGANAYVALWPVAPNAGADLPGVFGVRAA